MTAPAQPGGVRLSERTVRALVLLALAALALAAVFAVIIGSAPPLRPVPVASSPSA